MIKYDCLGRVLNIDDLIMYPAGWNCFLVARIKKFSACKVHLKKIDGSDFWKKVMFDPEEILLMSDSEYKRFKERRTNG